MSSVSDWMNKKLYYLLLLPSLIIILVIFVFPIIYTTLISFHEFNLVSTEKPVFVGLDNYKKVILSPRFRHAVLVTFYNLSLVITSTILLGFITALIFHQSFPARSVARTFAVIPMMATPAAIGLIMMTMYHPTLGVANYFLSFIGIPPQLWSYGPKSVIPAISLIQIWRYTPLAMLFMLGGLASIPEEPYEAATVDGATWWQKVRYITLPLLRPHIFVAAMILMIDVMKQFEIIFVMTKGGPGTASETINILLYLQAFSYFYIGEASALGLVFVAIMMAMILILLRYRRRKF